VKTEKKTVTEGGVTYNYEAKKYEGNDLPQLEKELTTAERQTLLIAVLRKQAAADKLERIKRTFEGTSDDDDDDHSMRERMTMFRLLIKEIISLADYDMDLEIVGPKLMDSMFCRASEKLRDNTREAWRATMAEKRANDRLYGGNEFDMEADRRLHNRLRGLEKQGRLFAAMFETCLNVRPEVIANSGIAWSEYNTLAQMASQRGNRPRLIEAKKAADEALKKVRGMSEVEYREYLARTTGYNPLRDGIEADDQSGAGHNQVAYLKTRREKEEEQARKQRQKEDEALIELTRERTEKRERRRACTLQEQLVGIAELNADGSAGLCEAALGRDIDARNHH
jgi:hypothetical protein